MPVLFAVSFFFFNFAPTLDIITNMNNFIVRTITAVIFVVAIVTCFLNPRAMVMLFALVTGMTIWEFTGLVNEHRVAVTVNRFICTAAGVFLFIAMAGYNRD